MSITELFSIGALFLTVSGFMINIMVTMSKRIRELEQGLAAETSRSETEDKNHSNVITEIKKDIGDINNKLDDLIKAIGHAPNIHN